MQANYCTSCYGHYLLISSLKNSLSSVIAPAAAKFTDQKNQSLLGMQDMVEGVASAMNSMMRQPS